MRLISDVDFKALDTVKDRSISNRDLVRLLTVTACEGYILTRLRQLETRGFITREGRPRIVSITPAGKNALALMTAEAEGRAMT